MTTFALPQNRNEARRLVWLTMIEVRKQLNKALGCKLKEGDFEAFTQMVVDKYYPRRKGRSRK